MSEQRTKQSMRPITFTAEEIRALQEGRKSQFRVVVNPQPPSWLASQLASGFRVIREIEPGVFGACTGSDGAWVCRSENMIRCPYPVGSRIWVRETWTEKAWDDAECSKMGCRDAPTHPTETYLDLPLRAIHRASCVTVYGDAGPWRSSATMPRWASRYTLEITTVRVERLQQISEADAVAEGTKLGFLAIGDSKYRESFRAWWDRTHKRYPWVSNPWCWVCEFRRVEHA